MERLVIINHATHNVIFDDVTDEMLEQYNGSEQDYIDANYATDDISWDYVVGVYKATEDGDFVDLEDYINNYQE